MRRGNKQFQFFRKTSKKKTVLFLSLASSMSIHVSVLCLFCCLLFKTLLFSALYRRLIMLSFIILLVLQQLLLPVTVQVSKQSHDLAHSISLCSINVIDGNKALQCEGSCAKWYCCSCVFGYNISKVQYRKIEGSDDQ